MSITNQSKPSTTLANSSKIGISELWSTIATTWATETRSWGATISLFINNVKINTNNLWASTTQPWQLPTPWLDLGLITNQSKP